jgi:DNA-directed RNA polymerase I, II, and III subunit RPABC2
MSLVTVTPGEITFPNVLNQEAVFMLKVTNTTSSAVAFKVKTTAPKNYLVKPSAGVLAANGDAEIKITLNKQTSDPSANNDRFLVQAVKSSTGKDLTKEEWQAVEKSSVQELRLHVVFGGSAVSVASSMGAAPVAIAKDATPEQVKTYLDAIGASKASARDSALRRAASKGFAAGERAVMSAAVLLPVAATISASEVDVSLSTVIALKVSPIWRDSIFCSSNGAILASVKI